MDTPAHLKASLIFSVNSGILEKPMKNKVEKVSWFVSAGNCSSLASSAEAGMVKVNANVSTRCFLSKSKSKFQIKLFQALDVDSYFYCFVNV